MAAQTEGAPTIDVEKWLKQNKLGHFYDLFQEKQIDIEEIAEFTDYDIEQFAKETLKLDVLSRKRFISAVIKVKQNQKRVNKPIQRAPARKRHVIISTAEQNGLNSLYERFDDCSKQQISIQKALNPSDQNDDNLNKYYMQSIRDINTIFDEVTKKLTSRQQQLLQNIDDIHQNKQNILKEQLNILQTEYIPLVKNGKCEYESYAKGQNKELNILEMVHNILTFNGNSIGTTISMTNPKIQFSNDIAMKLGNAFITNLKINDCDKPLPPTMKVTKVDSNSIAVQYDIKKEYYAVINKPILRICIQFAMVKHEEQIWNDYKEENEHFDDDKSDIDTDTETDSDSDDSDSDDSTQSDSDNSSSAQSDSISNESSSEDEGDTFGTKPPKKAKKKPAKKKKIPAKKKKKPAKKKKKRKKKKKKKVKVTKPKCMMKMMDFSSIKDISGDLQWKREEIKISKKDRKHDSKYKIEKGTKHNKTYILRIQSLNESGWSGYTQMCVVVKTPKILIKSKILTNKEKIKLFKLVDKQTKHRFNSWKLLYVGSKHGFTSFNFFKKCHGKKNTVCVINPSGSDNVFGGFTSITWDEQKNASQHKPGDKKAFIYLLRDSFNKSSKPRVWAIKKGMETAAVWYSSTATYLLFGENGYGFYMNNANTQVSASTSVCKDYGIPTHTLNGKTGTEGVKEVEVFQLK